MRLRAISSRGVGLVFVLLACLFPAGAAAMQPLSASNYSAEAVCAQPLPGHASCLANALVPETKAARAHSHPLAVTTLAAGQGGGPAEGDYGLRPQDLHNVYNLPLDAPTPQTIGIVDAYDDPTIEADLGVYDEEFGLPSCTHANGCFTKLNEAGNASPLPATNADWATEITLDVESAHAVCQNCKIVLVEASSNSYVDLEAAEDTAVAAGANEVSNSYGGVDPDETSAYDHPGVVITASTGDYGYDDWENTTYGSGFANYPASDPSVVAVGGTELYPFDESWEGETTWEDGGSGCSPDGAAPSWQTALPNWSAIGCGTFRASADISADADPYSGVAIYDSTPYAPYFPGWWTFGGTSLSSPIIAAMFALAGGSHGVEFPAQTVYANRGSSGLHDIVSGSNLPEGECEGKAICSAGSGYDGPTGVGSPNGIEALQRPRRNLTIHVAGSGQGAVTIEPGATSCATTCVKSFEEGTEIRLTGTPASGSVFSDWSGGPCSGTALCQFTLSGDTEIAATFDAIPVTTSPPPSPPAGGTNPVVTSGGAKEEVKSGGASALTSCLSAARQAYRRAVHAAHSLSSGRAAALRKAKRVAEKQAAACHQRF
jgi:hypothetical protein